MTASTETAQSSAADLREIGLGQIDEAENTRKTYDKGQLEELATSIKQMGVQTPVLVRPKGKRFELVYGYRRLRASLLAGVPSIPARVRELTDLEVIEHQLVENAQRADVHPLEEAAAYQRLQLEHGKSVGEIAGKIGKSDVHVRQRLKLNALGTAARAFFLSGNMSATVALLVARITDEKSQAKAAKEVSESRYNGTPMSAREAADHLQRHYMLQLERAPFDLASETLCPEAGACTVCPKRTGNQRELFSDVKSADVCTDPPCYDRKVAAEWKRVVAQAKLSGAQVLTDAEAKKVFAYPGTPSQVASGTGYVKLDDSPHEDPKRRSYARLIGKNPDGLVYARDPAGGIHKLLPKDGIKKALRDAGHDFWKKEKAAPKTPAAKAKVEEEKQERAAEELVGSLAAADLVDKLKKRVPNPAQWLVLVEIALEVVFPSEAMLERWGIKANTHHDVEALLAQAKKWDADKLRALFFDAMIIDGDFEFGINHRHGEKLLKAFGVDQKALRKQAIARIVAEKKAAAAAPPAATPTPKAKGKKR